MKKDTVKKPRKSRVTLISIMRQPCVSSLAVFFRDDGKLVYCVYLKEGFALCNLFKENVKDFAFLNLKDAPSLFQYVQELPF